MYFIELLVKKFKKKQDESLDYNPMAEDKTDYEDACSEHIFMPVDSTGETLACKNCGLIVNKKDLKDINFFRKAK